MVVACPPSRRAGSAGGAVRAFPAAVGQQPPSHPTLVLAPASLKRIAAECRRVELAASLQNEHGDLTNGIGGGFRGDVSLGQSREATAACGSVGTPQLGVGRNRQPVPEMRLSSAEAASAALGCPRKFRPNLSLSPRSPRTALGTTRSCAQERCDEVDKQNLARCIEALYQHRKSTLRFLRRCEDSDDLCALQRALDPQPVRVFHHSCDDGGDKAGGGVCGGGKGSVGRAHRRRSRIVSTCELKQAERSSCSRTRGETENTPRACRVGSVGIRGSSENCCDGGLLRSQNLIAMKNAESENAVDHPGDDSGGVVPQCGTQRGDTTHCCTPQRVSSRQSRVVAFAFADCSQPVN
eukprot:TRINITY_DN20963_c0_g1_i1.p1 TRINITY_DN20963_c0_g1~~TRINITY_DN20963_c0_g1_i1.p1  ORF type:complete len:352 (+),score=46.78 TRINITY_DN20963_c0_g1_i1:124-1179(+)